MARPILWFLLAVAALVALSGCAELSQQRNVRMFQELRRKADQGDPVAAMHLGTLYRDGIGTAHDPVQALRWYKVGGPHGGWAMIGDMYERGEGVPRDPELAASYHRRAAETGSPVAMYRLGCAHADERVAASDAVEGYMWLLLAKTIGESSGTCRVAHYECNEWAIKDRPGCRARLDAILTPGQRADAERRAAEWLATRSPTRK